MFLLRDGALCRTVLLLSKYQGHSHAVHCHNSALCRVVANPAEVEPAEVQDHSKVLNRFLKDLDLQDLNFADDTTDTEVPSASVARPAEYMAAA